MSAKGLTSGLLSGLKSGHAKCNMQSGYNGGLSNGIANNNKIQDPNLLRGSKLPWIYANADNTVDQGSWTGILDRMKLPELWNAYTGLPIANHPDYEPGVGDIDGIFVRTGLPYVTDTVNDYIAFGSNFSATNRPYPRVGGQGLGDHVYLDHGGNSGTATNLWLGPANGIGSAEDSLLNNIAPTALTIMMVMKSKNTAGKTHFWLEDNLTRGGIFFTQPTEDKLRLQLYSESGVSSVYESCNLEQELQDWILVTIKCTLKQINGPGSEQEFYVNGKQQRQFVSSNWTTPETYQAWTATSQGLTLGGAGTSAPVANGMYFASFLLLPYWANESEQLRLENYFRKYYGKKF
jgi:hypothetical protein